MSADCGTQSVGSLFVFPLMSAGCVPGPGDEQEYVVMRVRSRLAVMAVGCCVALAGAWAQAQPQRGPGGAPGGGPGAGPGGFGGGMGMFGGGFGGLGDILRRADVRGELELLDPQIGDLEKLAESRRDQMRELFSGLRDIPEDQRGEEMRKRMQKAQEQLEADIGKILLPHQMKRAKQLMMQMQMRGGRGLISGPLANELALTDAEREALQAKSAQLEEEIRKKTTALRAEAQQELLKVLPPAKQAKVKDLVGEPFEFQMEMPRPMGPPPQGGAPQPERPRRGGR